MDTITRAKEPAFKVYRRGNLCFARCMLTNVETYAKNEANALRDCKEKSIALLKRWIEEIRVGQEPFQPGDEKLFADEQDLGLELEAKVGEPCKYIDGSENSYMTKSGQVWDYNVSSGDWSKTKLKTFMNRQYFQICQHRFYVDTIKVALWG